MLGDCPRKIVDTVMFVFGEQQTGSHKKYKNSEPELAHALLQQNTQVIKHVHTQVRISHFSGAE